MFTERILQKPRMNALEAIIWWFATPERVALHLLSKVVRATVTPILLLFLGILVKRMFGLNKECASADATQLSLLRRYINSFLLSQEVQKQAFRILGYHYEIISVRIFLSRFARRCMLTPPSRSSTELWEPKWARGYIGPVRVSIASTPKCWRLVIMLYLDHGRSS